MHNIRMEKKEITEVNGNLGIIATTQVRMNIWAFMTTQISLLVVPFPVLH